MPASINSNFGLNAYRNLSRSSQALNESLTRLSGGLRVNPNGSDDIRISDIFTSSPGRGMAALLKSTDGLETGTSVAQTASIALDKTRSLLEQQRIIAERGATAGGVDSSQTALFQKMGGSIDQIAQTTSFRGQRLLDGSYTGKQFEAGSAGAPSLSLDVASSLNGQSAGFDMAGLGLSGLDLSSASGAQDAVTRIDAAMAEVERQSGELDTFISDSRQASMSQLQTVSQTEMTRSPIRDSDMALESTLLTRSQLLAQVGSTGLQSLHQDVSAQQAMALLR